jgi:apolipoprotein N-acyltransferase
VLVTELPRSAAFGFPTPYTRFGDWPGLLSLVALVWVAVRAGARSR